MTPGTEMPPLRHNKDADDRVREALARIQDDVLSESRQTNHEWMAPHARDILLVIDHKGITLTADLIGVNGGFLNRWLRMVAVILEQLCEGHTGLRWMLTDSEPVPETRLVKLAELPSLLPPDARRITAEERVEQLRRRRNGVDHRLRV